MKALERFLRPEFLGRVDEVVIFNQLTHDNFEKIVISMDDFDFSHDGIKHLNMIKFLKEFI